jgi:hypothetical protein
VSRISANNKKIVLQEANVVYLRKYRKTFYDVPEHSSWQLSADVDFLWDKAAVLGDVIKRTLPSIAVSAA